MIEAADVLDTASARRVAVVTGAASGIGWGVAHRFAADKDRVALLDRHGEAAEQAAAELREQGAAAVAHEVDVADWSAVKAVFERVRTDLGPVGILVTCAGIESFDPVLDITPETWDRILAVNLTGTFTCIQAALPDMIAAGWGRIVTISSSSALIGRAAHGPLRRLQRRSHRPYEDAGAGTGEEWHHGEQHPALTGGHADGASGRSQRAGQLGRDGCSGSLGTCRDSRGHRCGVLVPVF